MSERKSNPDEGMPRAKEGAGDKDAARLGKPHDAPAPVSGDPFPEATEHAAPAGDLGDTVKSTYEVDAKDPDTPGHARGTGDEAARDKADKTLEKKFKGKDDDDLADELAKLQQKVGNQTAGPKDKVRISEIQERQAALKRENDASTR